MKFVILSLACALVVAAAAPHAQPLLAKSNVSEPAELFSNILKRQATLPECGDQAMRKCDDKFCCAASAECCRYGDSQTAVACKPEGGKCCTTANCTETNIGTCGHSCEEGQDCCGTACIPEGAECCFGLAWCPKGHQCIRDSEDSIPRCSSASTLSLSLLFVSLSALFALLV